MKNKKNPNKEEAYGSIYNIFPASNCEMDAPFLIAEVQSVGKEKIVMEAYKSPDDFAQQSMELIKLHIMDEMIEKGLIEKMRITIKVEYNRK